MKACPMYVDRTRTRMQQLQQSQQLQQQSSCQRVGAVLDTILLGYQWAPQWVPARTPTVHWGPISGKAVGGPITVQHSSKRPVARRRNTANMVAEHCRSRARTLAARALLTRFCCVMTGQRNEEPIELMHEDFQVHVDSDWVGDLLGRMNTTSMIVRRCIEECVSMTSESKITFETKCENQ